MTKLLKKLKKLEKAISEKKLELSKTQDPLNGYYLQIGTELERNRDIEEIKIELRHILNSKHSLLDSIIQNANFEKVNVSQQENKFAIWRRN